MTTTIILTAIYLVSLLYNKWWFKQAYFNKYGEWSGLEESIGLLETLFIFLPIANTTWAIANLFFAPNGKHHIEKKHCKYNFIKWFIKL
jgi:hypothetical protein